MNMCISCGTFFLLVNGCSIKEIIMFRGLKVRGFLPCFFPIVFRFSVNEEVNINFIDIVHVKMIGCWLKRHMKNLRA